MLASQNREIKHYCPWGKKIINNIVSDNKNFSEIIATNDLKLTSSTGNIINKSKLASKGNITLAAAKDITNNSTVNTITNGENISSILLETASIEATNNLKILAGNNFENKAANLTTTQGDIDINVGNNINITSQQLRNKTTYSWGDKDEGGTITNDKTTNLQSSLTAKGNINLTSNNNIIIQAANINADNNIDINAGNGLYLLTAQNTDFQDISIREVNNWGMTFEQINKGHYNTSIIDNNITAGNGNSNININGQNKILAQYGHSNNLTEILNNKKQNSEIENNKITLQLQETINKNWDESVSGLTDVGMAVVAIAAVAVTVFTAGAAGAAVGGLASSGATVVGASAGMASTIGVMASAGTMAALSTAAVTFSTTATNATLNNKEGNFFKAFEDVAKTTVKTTTSKDSLDRMGKSFLTAFLTAGVVDGLGTLAEFASKTSDAANIVNNTATTTANAVNNIASSTNSFSSLLQQTTTTIKEATISTLSSATVQAVMEGESFTDTLKNQAQDILISAVANMGAKQIGKNYHTGKIGKATQLTLHAGLGAGTAALSGANAISGAVSGVIGEEVGEYSIKRLNQNQADKQGGYITASQIEQNKRIVKELSGVAGGLSAVAMGDIMGQDSSEIANNVWSGSRIGKNAAEHNALKDNPLNLGPNLIKLDDLGNRLSSKEKGNFDLKDDTLSGGGKMTGEGKSTKINIKNSNDVNKTGKQEFLKDNPNPNAKYQNSWKKDSKVIEFTTATDGNKFVRVFTQTKNPLERTRQDGNWLANPKDIKNLTPLQIRDKYALPNTPTHMTEVIIPKNIPIRTGTAGKNDFGSGGNRQLEVIGETRKKWYSNSTPLNK